MKTKLLLALLASFLISCATSTSHSVVATDANLQNYEFASISNVMGYGGSAILMDMEVYIYNRLLKTRLNMIGDREISNLSEIEKSKLLLVRFAVEIGLGGNVVSVNFVDYLTGRPIAAVTGISQNMWVAGDRLNVAIDKAIDEAVRLFSR